MYIENVGWVNKYTIAFTNDYTPEDKDCIIYNEQEYIYSIDNSCWYCDTENSILGLTHLQEMLITK
jgi:hypothetical protein